MKCIAPVIILLVSSSYAQVAFKAENGLFGFKENNDILISPSHDYATDFSEGLACVKKGNKWGYVNRDNEWLIEPTFDRAGLFQKDHAKVLKGGKYGLLDQNGTLVLNPIYDRISFNWKGIVIEQKGKVGLYLNSDQVIPCQYADVGSNNNGYAYGKTAEGLYDIYNQSGLLLKQQEHSFSSWSIYADDNTIAVENGKYGLYNTAFNKWVIDPNYEYIQKIYTEDYYEYTSAGNRVKFNHAFALFENKPSETDKLNTAAEANNKITLCKAASLKVVALDLLGYKQIVKGSGYNKVYNYELYAKGNSGQTLNKLLGVVEQPKVVIFRLHKIKRSEDHVELWKDDELLLTANSIKPFSYPVVSEDASGNKNTEMVELDRDVVLVQYEDYYGIYSLREHRFLIGELPITTEFSCGLGLGYSSFWVKYEDEGKQGVCVDPNDATPMTYKQIEGVGVWGFLKFKTEDEGQFKLCDSRDLDVVLCEADNFTPRQFGGGDFFIEAQVGEKVGVYNEYRTDIVYDELIDIEDPMVYGYRIGSNYGLYHSEHKVETGAIFDELPNFEEFKYYPYGYIQEGDHWIGLDGRAYQRKEIVGPIEDENGWGIGWENWVYKDGEDVAEHIFVSEARYKEVRDSWVYPNFRVMGMNGLWGVINHRGDTLIPVKYIDLGTNDMDLYWDYVQHEELITVYTKKGGGVYSTVKGVIIPDHYEYSERDYDFLDYNLMAIRVKSKKGTGYFLPTIGETIPPVFKEIYHAYDLGWDADILIVKNQKKKMGMMSVYGDTVLPIAYTDITNYEYDGYSTSLWAPLVKLEKGKKEGIFYPYAMEVLVPAMFDKVDMVEPYYDETSYEEVFYNGFLTTLKKKKGFYDFHGNELLPPIFDEIIPIPVVPFNSQGDVIVYGELDGKLYANYNSVAESDKALAFNEANYFDQIIGTTGFRFEENGTYIYEFETQKEQKGVTEFTIPGYEYDIYVVGRKFGAKDKEGNILVEAIYEEADFMMGRSEVMIGYENGVKYYIYVENNERYTESEW